MTWDRVVKTPVSMDDLRPGECFVLVPETRDPSPDWEPLIWSKLAGKHFVKAGLSKKEIFDQGVIGYKIALNVYRVPFPATLN